MLPVQIRMARAALSWGVRDLAAAAGVTANTITRIENGADTRQSTLVAIQQALEAAGIEFIPENGGGAGVRFKTGNSGTMGPAELEVLLASFSASRMDDARMQLGLPPSGVDLHFVQAGPQATLLDGQRVLGTLTLKRATVIYDPPLIGKRIGIRNWVTADDLWNWVLACWRPRIDGASGWRGRGGSR
jgi:transcriptional regulator with XRE-family HTH domain